MLQDTLREFLIICADQLNTDQMRDYAKTVLWSIGLIIAAFFALVCLIAFWKFFLVVGMFAVVCLIVHATRHDW